MQDGETVEGSENAELSGGGGELMEEKEGALVELELRDRTDLPQGRAQAGDDAVDETL